MQYDYNDDGSRQKILKQVKRVVVKVGSRLLMDVEGISPAERIASLVAEIHAMRQRGLEVIVVSSGAVAAGMVLMGTKKRPKSMSSLQAHAAVGQCELMNLYETASSALGFHCAQLLLTAADMHDQERHTSVSECLTSILRTGALPVINENDSVCVDEIKVGDNDTLAALVSNMARADLTILLTTINGMRERDKTTGELGRRISVVKEMDAEFLAMAQGTDGNSFSVGGMITKLKAAAMVSRSGEALWIADGGDFSTLRQVLAGEDIGTLFVSSRTGRMHAKQRFLAFFSEPKGELIIDRGAEHAIVGAGKSLLPKGILGLRGIFHRGDTVRLLNVDRVEIGRGMVNYDNADLSRICGCSSEELQKELGHQPESEEAVHRDFLVLSI
ncbi:MAG: glutamate 5-kinase [Victivallales bacterium]|nr:glutamate 5-kinase [Victivallales bacterium]